MSLENEPIHLPEYDYFADEEDQEALQHIIEFAQLDCDLLDVDEEDEQALMEVSEYTRMAVLRLHNDLKTHAKDQEHGSGRAH